MPDLVTQVYNPSGGIKVGLMDVERELAMDMFSRVTSQVFVGLLKRFADGAS